MYTRWPANYTRYKWDHNTDDLTARLPRARSLSALLALKCCGWREHSGFGPRCRLPRATQAVLVQGAPDGWPEEKDEKSGSAGAQATVDSGGDGSPEDPFRGERRKTGKIETGRQKLREPIFRRVLSDPR